MAPVKNRAQLLVFAAVIGLLSYATAQPPPGNQQSPANRQNPAPNTGPPLFGEPRPDVRPDPNPRLRIKRAIDCPFGYVVPRDKQQMPHLVVCVVRQPYEPEFVNSDSGLVIGGRTPAPTTLERTRVNQCISRPAGSYACGRGSTECCGPNQDNTCFPGAYACYGASAASGPKKACCMSK